MRHINGVYTQYFNNMSGSDGSIFRGRYKSILVNETSYILPLSRYIHLNPVRSTRLLARSPERFPHSSYRYYLNPRQKPIWLNQDAVLEMLNAQDNVETYADYMQYDSLDDDPDLYQKIKDISLSNCKKLISQKDTISKEHTKQERARYVSHEKILSAVALTFKIPQECILWKTQDQNHITARVIAMHLCRDEGGLSLAEIAKLFNINHYSTVSKSITKLLQESTCDRKIKNKITSIQSKLHR